MAEQKRRGWLSRLLGGAPDQAVVPEQSPAPLQSGQALELLFGPAGRAAAAAHDADSARSASDGAPLRTAPPPGTAAYAPPPEAVAVAAPPIAGLLTSPAVAAPAVRLRILAHIATRGDMVAGLDAWAGERGSGLQLEGLAVTPTEGIDPDDLEYRAMLHDGSLTAWHRDAAFCGTRGDILPLRGFALRLIGDAAATHRISYAAVFVDGSQVGPVGDGTLCAAPSQAGLEAIYVMVDPAG
jgi:hypothetical protein